MVTKRELATIKRLIDTMGATVMVDMQDYEPRTPVKRTYLRVQASEFMEGCTSCELSPHGKGSGVGTAPPIVTPDWPQGPARIAIVGEAPGPEEVKVGRPFIGRAGRVLRGSLHAAGIDPDACAYMNAVGCMPTSEGVLRPPSTQEQAACHSNLIRNLIAADVRYVLLLGAPALRQWRTDLKLTDVAGKLFIWRQRWFVYPMFHPNAVLRQSFSAAEWREQVSKFAQIVNDDTGLDSVHSRCIDCSSSVYAYDEDAVPWCREHFKVQQATRQQEDRRRRINNTQRLI
jgi:uracil-DNA glycosylase